MVDGQVLNRNPKNAYEMLELIGTAWLDSLIKSSWTGLGREDITCPDAFLVGQSQSDIPARV